MKKQIVNVSAVQSAKVTAVLYLVVSIPIVVVMALFMMVSGIFFQSLLMLVFAPVMYGVMGFVGTLIAAVIYNLVAARIGGIEYTTSDVA